MKPQICLLGIQKFAKDKQVLKQLQEQLGDKFINPTEIIKPKMKPFCFLQFIDEEEKNKFVKLIEDNPELKLRLGQVHNENAFEKQLVKKIKQQKQNEEEVKQFQEKHQNRDVIERKENELALQTAPLYQIKYEEQIEQKMVELKKVIKKLRNQFIQKNGKEYAPDWILDTNLIKINDPIICDDQFRFNYRNKSEFTISYNSQKEVCVGFNVGSIQKNNDSVEQPNTCPVTPAIAMEIANKFQTYLQQSKFQPFNRQNGSGVWRMLSVRKSDRTKQLLISVSINKDNLNEDEYVLICDELITLFKTTYGEFSLEGLLLMHSNKLGQDLASSADDTKILYGNSYYQEIILDKKINISYNAFSQNHTPQCDKLYQVIIDLCKNKKITKFLDLCAGSGTIGICVSDQIQDILAIEMNQSSCKDANENYKINNLQNCQIICSKVEDVIKKVAQDLKSFEGKQQLMACLDPPRAGVLNNVIEAIRTCKGIDHIIYISCSPPQVIDNLIQLCLPQSKKNRAPGFKLVNVTLVDMFPQTSHFEAVFYLERDYGILSELM
ncbi:unnamed protein product [Paramecium pentaurelia]|uniref:RNA methyltransferase n=1 Tax=Paramecium pentaurelia TaxID=43138 RepID=A0A8S1SGZ6_9CILI|nr:unnamed protein product [Paramecium pentaurelia]